MTCLNLIFSGIKCAAPVAPANGTVTLTNDNSTAMNAVATYKCDAAYQLVEGSATRTCEEDGKWSGEEPVCAEQCESENSSSLATYLQPVASYMHYLA